ncbi:heme o synthase [Mesorhizobium sp.]|uniref:heme o synthase n=1 Tax=Mesorhizobium sp. TaxID=1871066 RepID=UPI000FE34E6C|nr:heme o synthase [Mesorhizobium sp.]RWN51030.1 MAG: protoheme IX farnesyltransferase [Mesorhizobium sp.]RWN71838.1 MAG: protoheme IX farnesyltransferase [Mesorhizobium sp.]RWN72225.1 MAG: protoheme IX farnesyltransferase [Mesorhizobium sp.]RWN83941.1 MAG: protoheme IX farnesyltransferase [Mesorhizobium sp.]RWO08848.1 MAG: protoheme IX farnesyltransferase [Mesorhizobium sp.]
MSARESGFKDTGIQISEATVSDFFALLKPRVMALAVFTAFVGLMVAPGAMNPVIAVIAIGAIAVGAGAAGALNMWYDADIDALMSRTSKRPVPSGRVTPGEALGFGLVLSVLAIMTLGVLVGWLAASLLAFTIFFYVVIYTMWLKRSTPQNIVIGGAAGALPPVIGWAAATGAVGVESLVLFLIIFLWTPPHFWALALFKIGDYAAAGIPMMPNVAGQASTRKQIFVYSLILAPIGVLPWAFGFASGLYGIVSTALGAGFIWHAWKLLVDKRWAEGWEMKRAKALFAYSIFYLFAIFAVLLADTVAMRVVISAGN